MPEPQPTYRGRFAPSPTGPLHLGSLIAALASFLDARSQGGQWLLRMEDLDPPREQAGAADSILDSLRRHGLLWDGDVLYQSRRSEAYEEALRRLSGSGRLFACDCTRQMLGPGGSCGGRCRPRQDNLGAEVALRVELDAGAELDFCDRLLGPQRAEGVATPRDFTVKRKDGLYAYQLAVVVDDAEQGITDVVRGSDLLDSTPRQLWLQQLLGLPRPTYLHLPLITNAGGQKLSKQNHAPALDNARAVQNLQLALRFLGQDTPRDTREPLRLLQQAADNWRVDAIPACLAVPESTLGA